MQLQPEMSRKGGKAPGSGICNLQKCYTIWMLKEPLLVAILAVHFFCAYQLCIMHTISVHVFLKTQGPNACLRPSEWPINIIKLNMLRGLCPLSPHKPKGVLHVGAF